MLRKDDGFMVKEKIQKAKKPKYNTLQNVGWMVKIAWKNGKRVLLFCVLTAILEVLFNLVQLYIAPEVLARVEQKTPLWELLTTIGVFTAALFIVHGFKEYIRQNTLFPRVDVRSASLLKLHGSVMLLRIQIHWMQISLSCVKRHI